MRDRQVRLVFLAMILAFPVLLGIVSGAAVGPVVGVEGVVVLGLLHSVRERRRLIAAATPRLHPVAASRTPARQRAMVQA